MDGLLSDLVKIGGLPFALLVLALVAGMRGDWLFGWIHREIVRRLESENDQLREREREWMDLYRRAITATEANTDVAERAIDVAAPLARSRGGGTGGPGAGTGSQRGRSEL